jgi:peptidoglycan/xylan/chitin deacetylase (PgdA/CDA1 family)
MADANDSPLTADVNRPGPALVISLDMELHWGMADKVAGPEHSYWNNLLGARQAVPRLLKMFSERGIHATWAAVGLLFARGREDLEAFLPAIRPRGVWATLDRIRQMAGASEEDDPLHFAPSLIAEIQATPGQEIASHTFCHTLGYESEVDGPAFLEDLQAAQAIARRDGLTLKTLVFPRNQILQEYLSLLPAAGFEVYRGNPSSGAHGEVMRGLRRMYHRTCRLADSYLPVYPDHVVTWREMGSIWPVNVCAGRFWRPIGPGGSCGAWAQQHRTIRSLQVAAQKNGVFHLWFHPHNFGVQLQRNMDSLGIVLDEFEQLRKQHGMRSMNMQEAAAEARRWHAACAESGGNEE